MTNNAYVAAANTLASAPLFAGTLSVNRRKDGDAAPEAVANAVIARFVGAPSADLAVALADPDSALGEAGGKVGVGIADLLRPLLVTAAEQLGAGVLGDATATDAAELFTDPDSLTFEVSDPRGVAVAWFAIRAIPTLSAGPIPLADVAGKLGRISNVEMALTVEIGRTRMSVRDVLAVEPGAVIELDRSAGSPADIMLNGRMIARGEIVVVDQDYAVRITQILDTADELV
jgi:flagellar motor switch protein FliN/FliY